MGFIKRIKKRRAKRAAKLEDLRQDMTPRKVHLGGSKKESKAIREDFKKDAEAAEREALRSAQYAKDAAGQGARENYALRQEFKDLANQNRESAATADARSGEAWTNYGQDRGNFESGRTGIMDNAAFLENSARNMVSDFRRTDDLRRTADMEAAQRQALSAARSSGGGALAIRNALASQAAANAQAVQGSAVTRANETNALLGMQNDAMANAAKVRTNLSGQDLSAAGQSAGIAGQMGQQGLAARDAAAGNVGAQAGLVQADTNNYINAAQLGGQIGTALHGQNTTGQLTAGGQQLGADQSYEILRQQVAGQKYIDEKSKPTGIQKVFGKAVSWITDPMNIRGSESGETWLSSAS